MRAVLIGSLVALLFAAVATSGVVRFADRAPSFTANSVSEESAPQPPPTVVVAPIEPRPPTEFSPVFELIARVVLYLCLAVGAALAAWFIWRHWPQWSLRGRRQRPAVEVDILDDVAKAVTADAVAQHEALQHGAPRNAIVECWLRLERAVISAGVVRRPSDTSSELTERVLAASDVDPVAITKLATLYREARFSLHEMDESSRLAAIDALDAVHRGLRSGSTVIAG